jgi:uncharacterized protein YigA (DUF484 family)
MVDWGRDRPKPAPEAPAATAERLEITARDVIAYLRQHPDFLDRHPEALRVLRPPTRTVSAEDGDGVVDFQHFLLDRLRRDVIRLNGEHRTLIATSRGNLASQSRVHKAVVAILGASSFEQLFQIATTDLAVLLDVDVVTIGVESATTPANRLPSRLPLHGIHLLKTGTVEHLLGPERTALLDADVHGDPALFGAAAGLVRSQALLRLSFGRGAPVGLLCIGARKPGRFHPGLGTELLSFLARTLGITIAQWLNPARLSS